MSGLRLENARWKRHFRTKISFQTLKDISFILALSLILVHTSHTYALPHIHESIENQVSILSGRPLIFDGVPNAIQAFYNRILFPVLFLSAKKLVPYASNVQIFLCIRLASFFVCLLLVFESIKIRTEAGRAEFLLILTSMAFIPTFFQPWITPSDIFDFFFCFYIFLSLAEGNYVAAFSIALVTAINRETGAFAAIAYIVFHFGNRSYMNLIARGAGMLIAPYLLAVGIRSWVFGKPLASVGSGQTFSFELNEMAFNNFVRHPSPIGWPSLLFAMLVLALAAIPRNLARERRCRLLIAELLVTGVTMLFGIVSEPRIFLPSIALLMAWVSARQQPIFSGPSSVGAIDSQKKTHVFESLTELGSSTTPIRSTAALKRCFTDDPHL